MNVHPGFDGPDADPDDRLVSREAGEALLQRIVTMTTPEGDTHITVRSSWTTTLKWARNRPVIATMTLNRWLTLHRVVKGTSASTTLNQWDDTSLATAVRTTEQRLLTQGVRLYGPQTYLAPPIWSASTFQQTAQERSVAVLAGVTPVVEAQLMAAGFAATDVVTWGIYNTQGLRAYAAATGARYGMTVREPQANGVGWAGVIGHDWNQLQVTRIAAHAMERCLASANPRVIEPGRYTVILEPEAIAGFIFLLVAHMDRERAETRGTAHPYGEGQGRSKIGRQLIDERLSVQTDPMDPVVPFIPFDSEGHPFQATTWIDRGVLRALAYDRGYARRTLGTDTPLKHPMAVRVINHGAVVGIEDMIASTERGVLIARVGEISSKDNARLQVQSVTRDGLWVIEKGKRRSAAKNMHIQESLLSLLNNVVHIGAPIPTAGRKFIPPRDDLPSMALNDGLASLVVPAMHVRDFNFTMLADTV